MKMHKMQRLEIITRGAFSFSTLTVSLQSGTPWLLFLHLEVQRALRILHTDQTADTQTRAQT